MGNPKEKDLDIPQVDVDVDEGLSVDEALAKVAMLLANVKEPRVLSEVNEEEIKLCSALFVVANRMQDKMLADFLANFLLLRVSKKRKGRDELLQIAKSAREASTNMAGRLKNLLTGVR